MHYPMYPGDSFAHQVPNRKQRRKAKRKKKVEPNWRKCDNPDCLEQDEHWHEVSK